MTKAATYTLRVGAAGAVRLEMLDKIYEESTQRFLLNIGLKKGMHVADVGCGMGALLPWLAEQVGEEGSVTAIDFSIEQLELAEAKVKQAGYNNVSFKECDVYNLLSLNKRFDLVHSRFFLMHLSENQKALQIMYQMVAPNGLLVCEEIENTSWFTMPPSSITKRRMELVIDLGKARGLNYNLALELPFLFKNIHCHPSHIHFAQPIIPESIRLYQSLMIQEWKQEFIKARLANEDEIDYLIIESNKMAEDPNIIFVGGRLFQVAGYKKI